MSALSPGLYRATVNGNPDVVISVDRSYGYWLHRDGTMTCSDHDCITDARPLIVLDLGAHLHHYVVTDLRNAVQRCGNTGLTALADQIEAQTKPPKPAEPTDLAARVWVEETEWAKVGPWWVCASLNEAPRSWDSLVDLGGVL